MAEMQYVTSSNVEQIGYDEASSELHVIFLRSPTLYVYLGVPRELFDQLLASESKGSFINRQIKPNYGVEKR